MKKKFNHIKTYIQVESIAKRVIRVPKRANKDIIQLLHSSDNILVYRIINNIVELELKDSDKTPVFLILIDLTAKKLIIYEGEKSNIIGVITVTISAMEEYVYDEYIRLDESSYNKISHIINEFDEELKVLEEEYSDKVNKSIYDIRI